MNGKRTPVAKQTPTSSAPVSSYTKIPVFIMAIFTATLLAFGLSGCGTYSPNSQEIVDVLQHDAITSSNGVRAGGVGATNKIMTLDGRYDQAVNKVVRELRDKLGEIQMGLVCPKVVLDQAPSYQQNGSEPRMVCAVMDGEKARGTVWMSTGFDGRETILSAIVN